MFPVRRVLQLDIHTGTNEPVHVLLFKGYEGHRPAEEPFGGLRGHVNAAMAARASIIIVPVGAMEGDTFLGYVKHPGHAWEVKTIGGNITSHHVPGGTFMVCNEFAIGRAVSSAV